MQLQTQLRVGEGWDTHALVPGRPLMLGGVHVPYERGLLGRYVLRLRQVRCRNRGAGRNEARGREGRRRRVRAEPGPGEQRARRHLKDAGPAGSKPGAGEFEPLEHRLG